MSEILKQRRGGKRAARQLRAGPRHRSSVLLVRGWGICDALTTTRPTTQSVAKDPEDWCLWDDLGVRAQTCALSPWTARDRTLPIAPRSSPGARQRTGSLHGTSWDTYSILFQSSRNKMMRHPTPVRTGESWRFWPGWIGARGKGPDLACRSTAQFRSFSVSARKEACIHPVDGGRVDNKQQQQQHKC